MNTTNLPGDAAGFNSSLCRVAIQCERGLYPTKWNPATCHDNLTARARLSEIDLSTHEIGFSGANSGLRLLEVREEPCVERRMNSTQDPAGT